MFITFAFPPQCSFDCFLKRFFQTDNVYNIRFENHCFQYNDVFLFYFKPYLIFSNHVTGRYPQNTHSLLLQFNRLHSTCRNQQRIASSGQSTHEVFDPFTRLPFKKRLPYLETITNRTTKPS